MTGSTDSRSEWTRISDAQRATNSFSRRLSICANARPARTAKPHPWRRMNPDAARRERLRDDFRRVLDAGHLEVETLVARAEDLYRADVEAGVKSCEIAQRRALVSQIADFVAGSRLEWTPSMQAAKIRERWGK